MAVVEAGHEAVALRALPRADAVRILEGHLRAVAGLLDRGRRHQRAAFALLQGVNDSLAGLASAAADQQLARRLLQVRDDLSGHLLAARICEDEVGACCPVTDDILRRAVTMTANALGHTATGAVERAARSS